MKRKRAREKMKAEKRKGEGMKGGREGDKSAAGVSVEKSCCVL